MANPNDAVLSIIATIPITYATLDGDRVHSPMIVGRVGGIETRLVLDTGSEVHLINRELADAIGLIGVPGEDGIDHAGATMASLDVGPVSLDVDGFAIELADVVAIPAPPPFPGWGIGGILSPQRLHPTASIVIDLRADEMVLVDHEPDRLPAWLAHRAPELDLLDLPRDPAFPSLVVTAAIEPYPEIPVMLNTGGKHTEFLADVVPGIERGLIERSGGGVSGADVRTSLGGRQQLHVAGRRITIGELYLRASMLEPHGLVGMDVLRGTILTAARDPSRGVVWQVPGSTR